jgi:protein-tyrosine-phosphatase
VKILVICSGNICRSPMVAAYLRHRLNRSDMAHVVVSSAGTLGIRDAPASDAAIAAMAEIDIDLGEHRSRALSAADLRSSEWVLAMDHGHLETLAARYPEGRDKRVLLRAFEAGPDPSPNAPDLDDPVGMPVKVFRKQRDLIRVCVDHFVLHLKHETSPS